MGFIKTILERGFMPQNVQNELQFFSKSSREPIYDRRLAERVIFLADLKPNSLILDAGCGEGYWGRAFAKSGHQVVGIDLSSEVINRAVKKAVPRQSFLVGNLLEKLPFANKHFDCIICGGVLHHFPDREDINTAFHNLYNSLKNGGKIILVEPNGSNFLVCLSRQIGCFLVRYYSKEIASENETIHSIKTYLGLLEKNKLKVLTVESYRHDMSKKMKNNKKSLINYMSMIRRYLGDIIWATFPEPNRGNEIIIIVGKNFKRTI